MIFGVVAAVGYGAQAIPAKWKPAAIITIIVLGALAGAGDWTP